MESMMREECIKMKSQYKPIYEIIVAHFLPPKLEENVKKYYDEFNSRIKMCIVSLTTNIVQPRTFKNLHKAQYYCTFLNRENFICSRLSENYNMKTIFWTSAILTLGLNLVICLPADEIIGKIVNFDSISVQYP